MAKAVRKKERPLWREDLASPTDRWYWAETRYAAGLLIVGADDCIGDGHPAYIRWFCGRPLAEFMHANKDVSLIRLENGMSQRLKDLIDRAKNQHKHDCRMCHNSFICAVKPKKECRKFLCPDCRDGTAGR